MTRHHWNDLPATVRQAVYGQTGHIEKVESVVAGSVASIAVGVHSAGAIHFCKGIEVAAPHSWMLYNEARLNAYLPHDIVPALRWIIERDGWLLLGFDHADGRHADLTVSSPDLPRIADTFNRLTAALTPCRVKPIQPATARWAGRVASEFVDGETMLHTDMTPRNFLVGEDVAVVDWSTPCRGAAWIDAALMVVRLIRAGHTPYQAEQWAGSLSSWAMASPCALDAFVPAMAALYDQRNQESPAPHRGELAAAAQCWAAWRTTAQ